VNKENKKSETIKILDVGIADEQNTASNPTELFSQLGELEIETMDIDPEAEPTYVYDLMVPLPPDSDLIEKYDIVHCSHMLEHVNRNKVMTTITNLAKMVKVGGELWVIVPSMEWAAREIISNRESVYVQMMLYGGQNSEYDFHRVGFTLITLRQLLDAIGLVIRQAHQSIFSLVQIIDGDFQEPATAAMVPENVVVALKVAPIVEQKDEDTISETEEK